MVSPVASHLLRPARELLVLDYLGCPYSSNHPSHRTRQYIMDTREAKVTALAGMLMDPDRDGGMLPIYSPITHSAAIARRHELPRDWVYWERYDRNFLAVSRRLLVYMMDGWQDSVGLTAEIQIMSKEYRRPVLWIPDCLPVQIFPTRMQAEHALHWATQSNALKPIR